MTDCWISEIRAGASPATAWRAPEPERCEYASGTSQTNALTIQITIGRVDFVILFNAFVNSSY
jgi:hypothetical protein